MKEEKGCRMKAAEGLPVNRILGELARESGGRLIAGFIPRIEGIEGSYDRDEILRQASDAHAEWIRWMGCGGMAQRRAQQVHGKGVAIVRGGEGELETIPGVDGLVTDRRGVMLGIYVADCAAVWLVDVEAGVLGLVHSGKAGSLLDICGEALREMAGLGARAERVQVVISPCIRPGWYEVDVAGIIRQGLIRAGVLAENIRDCETCTASEVENYYSYRREKGKTGRMLAVAALIGAKSEEEKG